MGVVLVLAMAMFAQRRHSWGLFVRYGISRFESDSHGVVCTQRYLPDIEAGEVVDDQL